MPALEPACIEVIRPGFLTTVQDLGRTGYQRFGMPVGGAMDPIALCLANRLVGNADGAAALEITVKGPEVLFVSDAIVALTGALRLTVKLSSSSNLRSPLTAMLIWTVVSPGMIDKLPLVVPLIMLVVGARFSAENSEWNDPDVTTSTSVKVPIVAAKYRIA